MTTRRRHYILCTYGEEQQSEFMYTRLIRCIQLVRHGTHNIVIAIAIASCALFMPPSLESSTSVISSTDLVGSSTSVILSYTIS